LSHADNSSIVAQATTMADLRQATARDARSRALMFSIASAGNRLFDLDINDHLIRID
jgi:hypothetical protein